MAKNKKTANKNTRTVRRRHSLLRRNIGWIIFFVVLIASAVVVVLKLVSPLNQDHEEEEPKAEETTGVENSNAMDNSAASAVEVEKEKDDSGSKTPTKYDGEDANKSATVTGNITFSGVSGKNYVIRVNLDQALDASGQCTLVATSKKNSSFVVRKNVGIKENPASSSCDGFDISLAEFNKGDYDVVIEINAGNKTGTLRSSISIP